MRRKDKQITDTDLLHEVIHRSEVCRLGLVDGKEPYVIPISFGFDGHNLYFHSARAGRKVDILQKNSRVCVEFEQDVKLIRNEAKYCDWSVQYFSVVCYGDAVPIENIDEKNYGLNQVIKHYSPDAPEQQFTEKELAPVLVYKISLDQMVGKKSLG